MGAAVSFIDGSSKQLELHPEVIKYDRDLTETLASSLKSLSSLSETFARCKEYIYTVNEAVFQQLLPHLALDDIILLIVEQIENLRESYCLEDSEPERTFNQVFSTYIEIIQSSDIKHSLPSDHFLSYSDYCQFLESRQPTSYRFLDASLRIEMGLRLLSSDQQQAILSSEKKKELGQFLTDAIQVYGAYCILLGYWKPREEDNGRTTEGIRLFYSKLQAELGMSSTYDSVDDLFHDVLDEEN